MQQGPVSVPVMAEETKASSCFKQLRSVDPEVFTSDNCNSDLHLTVLSLNNQYESIRRLPESLVTLATHYLTNVADFYRRIPTIIQPPQLPEFEDVLAFMSWPKPVPEGFGFAPPKFWQLAVTQQPDSLYPGKKPEAPPGPCDEKEDAEIAAAFRTEAPKWCGGAPIRSHYETSLTIKSKVFMTASDEEVLKLVQTARLEQLKLDGEYQSDLAFHDRMQGYSDHLSLVRRCQKYDKELAEFTAHKKSIDDYYQYLEALRKYPAEFHEYTRQKIIFDWWQQKESYLHDVRALRGVFQQYQANLQDNKEKLKLYEDQQDRFGRQWWVDLDVIEKGAQLGTNGERFYIDVVRPGWHRSMSECSESNSYGSCRHGFQSCNARLETSPVTEKRLTKYDKLRNVRFSVDQDAQGLPAIRLSFVYKESSTVATDPCVIILVPVTGTAKDTPINRV